MANDVTDEMIDAACAAVPDLYRVDAMLAIEAALAVAGIPATGEAIPDTEQPCYCGPGISLQSVSGGAHETGLFGTVWLHIDDESVEYVRKSASSTVVPVLDTSKLTPWPPGIGLEPEKLAQAEARIRAALEKPMGHAQPTPEPRADDPYLAGVCTESGCSLCRTPVALRKRGQFHAGICNVSKEPGHD